MTIMVSACLAGVPCRYDGASRPHPIVMELLRKGQAFAFCPETAGGLSVPRPPAEITQGGGEGVWSGKARVVTRDGTDVTDQFVRGATEALNLMLARGAGCCVLVERSPSCGKKSIYDGTFTGAIQNGSGVTASLLLKAGLKVISSDELDSFGPDNLIAEMCQPQEQE